MPEAYAVVREGIKRVLNMRPYDVQLMGGIVLHQGRVAEMKTGEGKTLVATFPAYLNALTGKGVHIVTANKYLARRDKKQVEKLFNFLGLTVGLTEENMLISEKKKAYECDIMYGANSEFGFDYLRDNITKDKEKVIQKALNYAIVDEADTILIDEIASPLIISHSKIEPRDLYIKANEFVKKLNPKEVIKEVIENENDNKNYDYIIDKACKSVVLTQRGIKKAEKEFNLKNYNDIENTNLIHHINQALNAYGIMEKDKDYIVENGKIYVVDQFTGRVMEQKKYSRGLQQALETKENLKITKEQNIVAMISNPAYFQMYSKLSGMTGTAKTVEEEFEEIYKLDVVEIPTNRPCIREDYKDEIYKTKREKNIAIIKEIKQTYGTGQPILIGTTTIKESEELSNMLKKEKIPHAVLNAKKHEEEAEIIEKAGLYKSVTIATNMAGRGTNIELGKEKVIQEKGLKVIGTEKHEERRIDEQLRGRSGRQGMPGKTKFYISLEDEIIKISGIEKHSTTQKHIKTVQKELENKNRTIRKQIIKYDEIPNFQRKIIYNKRRIILETERIEEEIEKIIKLACKETAKACYEKTGKNELENVILYNLIGTAKQIKEYIKSKRQEELTKILQEKAQEKYKENNIKVPIKKQREKIIDIIDKKWIEHIYNIEELKNGIGLRAYAKEDPILQYIEETTKLFENLNKTISEEIAINLMIFRE